MNKQNVRVKSYTRNKSKAKPRYERFITVTLLGSSLILGIINAITIALQ